MIAPKKKDFVWHIIWNKTEKQLSVSQHLQSNVKS